MTTHAPHPIQDEAGHNEDLVAGAHCRRRRRWRSERQIDRLYDDFDAETPDAAVDPDRRADADDAAAPMPCRTCGAGRRCCRWPSGPVSWCRSGAAGSAGRSRWPTRACRARRTRPRRCGRAIQYLGGTRWRPSTGTARTRSGSWSRARGCGPSSTATRSRCAAATSCSPRAGTSTATTTRPTSRWPGSTAWTSRSCTTPTPASSSSAPTGSTDESTPDVSRVERLWGHPGLRPLSQLHDTDVLADRRLPLGAHRRRACAASWSWRRPATPPPSNPATPRSGTPTRPPAAT